MSQGPIRKPKRTRISLASRAGDKASPLGVIGSLALHGLVIAGMMFTFAHRLDIVDQSSPVVPVDLVTLSAKTNVMPSVRSIPKMTQVSPPRPPVETQEPVQPQEEPQPAPAPEQAPSEPVIKLAPPPPATPTIRPQQEKPKKKTFDVDNVLALLNKVAPSEKQSNSRVSDRTIRGIGAQDAMTADLISMLSSQIMQCYSPPIGAPHPEDLVVDFDVFLNPDGSVARAPQFLGQDSNTYTRAAKEAALRAIYTCAPYKLPADRYNDWREINPLHFDPRPMLGD